MKGIIFNLVEEAVTAGHGEQTWDAILEAADLGGEYTSLGNYPCPRPPWTAASSTGWCSTC